MQEQLYPIPGQKFHFFTWGKQTKHEKQVAIVTKIEPFTGQFQVTSPNGYITKLNAFQGAGTLGQLQCIQTIHTKQGIFVQIVHPITLQMEFHALKLHNPNVWPPSTAKWLWRYIKESVDSYFRTLDNVRHAKDHYQDLI